MPRKKLYNDASAYRVTRYAPLDLRMYVFFVLLKN